MDQFGEFDLRVPEPVSPVFEPFLAGRPCFDASVVDWSVFSVGRDAVEEACVSVLVYREFFVSDGDGKERRFHGSLIPFRPVLWCRGFPP